MRKRSIVALAVAVPAIAVGVVVPVPRVAVGAGVAFALCAVMTVQLRQLLRRRWAAVRGSSLLIVLPYVVTSVPLLPDPFAQWLLRITPAAGFAALQTVVQYPQVVAHYAPSAGYFPLPWWAGLLVLAAWPAALALLIRWRRARRSVKTRELMFHRETHSGCVRPRDRKAGCGGDHRHP
ncbi:hypothetical protein AB0F72_32005 [Actinoplanes sp. NPDC023936]|uniref:hypothetical protein n=1 Tax=Actinoplanes sp. NPDC023936 TaxID=3154910 RepID=UPI0033CC82DF